MAALDLEEVYERYEDVWREGMNRWTNGLNQIRAGSYDPKQLFKDVAYLWVEGTIGPWVPKAVLPNLRMNLSKGAKEAFGSKWVRPQGPGAPGIPRDLAASAGAPLPANQVTAAFTQDNTVLVVRIEYGGAGVGPVGTTYTGSVTQGGRDLVYVRATVTP